jgi:hypothetical protein
VRFGSASTHLGHSDTAVRIVGVYAMAAADESAVFGRRQQCIDMLCGYLRLPYDPDSGANHLSEFVSTTTWSATPPAVNIEETRRQAVRQNEREVRDTIVRVGFSSEETSFGPAVFKCLRASFVSPTESKNVDFDWDNPPGGTQPAIPRCITPRLWPPYLVARESGTGSPPAGQDKDDNLVG